MSLFVNIRSWLTWVVGVVVVLAFVPAHASDESAQTDAINVAAHTTAREYVDVSAYLTSEADIEAWYQLVSGLKQNFDDICGDTFCEGDFSNIQALRFRCSVDRLTGTLGQCVWVFAASNEEIDPATGKIGVDPQTWRCKSPLARGTRISDFLAALAGPSPLTATLPGTQRSIYDGLMDCL
ncbi:hypothetical protein [Hyalangium versicolor]|uniref:hypothetical protein n=1 Tax=Hyalangium versicolor TaxID=2861190 RepID=UPI001CCCFECD|nr:hypothetical protein [Hyalangium versicolor]